ncbi:MAG: hypothetical protein ACRDSJ_09020 [Rubrobacteraceae bacterium]
MSITFDLPKELEDELSAEASRLGLSLPEYVVRILATASSRNFQPETGAQLVEFWRDEELVGSRPDITDSRTHARGLRRQAERRERA